MSRKNQWSTVVWSEVPWENLGSTKRRERLFDEVKHSCSQCGYNKTRSDGASILEIDHIDGDHRNNAKENLRVLCPNCHALTPNFRNFGRGKDKTSSRFRRGNKGFDEARKLIKQQELAYETQFRETVIRAHQDGLINFQKFGWVQRLSEMLNDQNPNKVGKRLRRLMPEFFAEHCFFRKSGKKRLV